MTNEIARRMLQVKPGKFVHLPHRLITHQRGNKRIWMRPGAVIDATDPFLTHCLLGQEYKLGPAPEGAQITVEQVNHPLIRAYRKELARKAEPPKPDPKKVLAKAAAQESGLLAGGIPAPDAPPAPSSAPAPEGSQGELIPGTEDEDLDPTPRNRGRKK